MTVLLMAVRPAGCLPTQIQLTIDDIDIGQGRVHFAHADPDTTTGAPPYAKQDPDYVCHTGDNRYQLIVDHNSYKFFSSGSNYTFNTYAILSSGGTPIKFVVKAYPKADFGDDYRTIRFHLHDGSGDHTGDLTLPLHDIGPNNLIGTVDPDIPLQSIKVSRSNYPRVTIQNKMPEWAVVITKVEVFSTMCPECWESLSGPSDLSDGQQARVLDAKVGKTDIDLNVKPKAPSALETSATHFSVKDPHDQLNVRMTYAPAERGEEPHARLHRKGAVYSLCLDDHHIGCKWASFGDTTAQTDSWSPCIR
jgi:hypothetical protein